MQAANGTNSASDRSDIQKEIDQLLTEVDRVGNTTKYNDFSIVDLALGRQPFTSSSDAEEIALQAVVANPASPAYGTTSYRLIYGNGSTSSSSLRIEYGTAATSGTGQLLNDLAGAGTTEIVELNSLTPGNYQFDEASLTWSRDLEYTSTDGAVSLTITQKIQAVESGTTEKYYTISYDVANHSPTAAVKLEFMFHADTAYNNNDRCEGYYINGAPVENTQAAESRIRDTDMAREMVAYSANNIITQAASSFLAQLTKAPQSVIRLLQ